MHKLTLDWETYYDSAYSLRHLPTAVYIHDPQFLIHGLGYKFGEGASKWLTELNDIHELLDSVDWSNTALVGHNLLFDAYILFVHFNYIAKQYIDTASMARMALPYLKSHSLKSVSDYLNIGKKDRTPLHNVKGKRSISEEEAYELGKYCKGDCDKSWLIQDRLNNFIPDFEFQLMDITTRMMVNPQFRIDNNLLENLLAELEAKRAELVKQSGLSITTLRSTAKLVPVLADLNVPIPTKISPSDPEKVIPTFEKDHPDVAELLIHENPQVRNIIKARLNVMSSLQINRAKRFLSVSHATGGVFPVPLKYYAAHTGRWGGSDKLNTQNIPRGDLRRSLVAPPHHVILPIDLGQIEARLTAWLAEHFELLEKFRDESRDIYVEFASEFYGVPYEQIEELGKKSNERFVGKTCVLGLGFGMGWKKLRYEFLTKHAWTGIVLSKDEAFRAVDLYRHINYPIKAFWDFLNDTVIPRMAFTDPGTEYGYKCLQYGKDYIRLPSGRCLVYPNLRAEEGTWPDGQPKMNWVYDYKDKQETLYGGKFTENLAQALARDLNGEFMVKIHERYPIATMTHDENVIVPHKAEADEAKKFMLDVMTTPPKWAPDLPLIAEGEYNERYS